MNRYLFSIPSINVYHVCWADSKYEARHLLMNSRLAPYYGEAILLTPDDRR
jgi:hypothetical protein